MIKIGPLPRRTSHDKMIRMTRWRGKLGDGSAEVGVGLLMESPIRERATDKEILKFERVEHSWASHP